MKVIKAFPDKPEYSDMLSLYCPACKTTHHISVGPKSFWKTVWGFNGDYDKPTFTPSLLVTMDFPDGQRRCHSFITDGKIQYLGDCTHEMAGKTIELPEISEMKNI